MSRHRKILIFFSCLAMVIFLAGCFPAKHMFPIRNNNIKGISYLPAYSGPRAKIMVADFDIKESKAGFDVGPGLREMLISALTDSGRFSVIEQKALNGQATGHKTADLIVNASVVEFEPQASGGRAGIGGGGGENNGLFGGLLGSTLNKARLSIDIRLLNAQTSRVLTVNRIQTQASDIIGNIMAGDSGKWELKNGLASYINTPMEKAIRLCMLECVRYILQATPANYYK